MKIIAVETYQIAIPYKQNYKPGTRMNTVIKLTTDQGHIGFGEGGTLSSRQPDSYYLVTQHLAPHLLGLNPLEIPKIMGLLDCFLKDNWFAKCAIDHALYDLSGKILNVPAYTLLGGKQRDTFQVSFSLPSISLSKDIELTKELVKKGYYRIGLRANQNPKDDLFLLNKIRQTIGNDIQIEVDFNGHYDKCTAENLMLEMEKYDIQTFEQPTNDLESMRELTNLIETPIVADESVVTISDAISIIKNKSADILCLKPFKSGGLYYLKQIQSMAESFNTIMLSLGSMHPFGIGTAALHHFAAASKTLSVIGYGSPLERLTDDIVKESGYDFRRGEVTIFEKPGLGIEIDTNKLKKYCKKHEKFLLN